MLTLSNHWSSIFVYKLGENKCEGHNGGCSHLCLRTSLGYSCACPTGIKLQDNEHDCEEGMYYNIKNI